MVQNTAESDGFICMAAIRMIVMSWVIVGDQDRANFACDTGMEAFGPLHINYTGGSAKEELREFARSLDLDPRKYDEQELRDLYVDWKR
jgi:hypothetical protein